MDYLHCGCPVLNCPNMKNPTYWYHNNCGGKTMLRYDDINIVCSTCKKSDLVFHWNFRCENHDAKPASFQGIIFAMSIMAQTTSDQEALQKAIGKLNAQWPK